MDKKVGLNNVQRRMLDEIYTEQFDKVSSTILNRRREGYQALSRKVLKEEADKAPLKTALVKFAEAYKAAKHIEDYLSDNGLRLDNRIYEVELEVSTYSGNTHPKLLKHSEETREIEIDLAKKKKEIRARIYGMDTTYEEVEKEISKEIASIKTH